MLNNPGAVNVNIDENLVDEFFRLVGPLSAQTPHYKNRVRAIIESGTYHGQGTTAAVIAAVKKSHLQLTQYPKMITIEANENNYKIAWKNLRQHCGWITVKHGTSVGVQEAIDFMENDELLLNHQQYTDILIDSQDPIPFYCSEIKGQLAAFGAGKMGSENLFERFIPKVRNKKPLFILDSCGGMGLLEFNRMIELMGRERYYVFLHDINHVKHYRSYQIIQNDATKRWRILAEKKGEWVLALHRERAKGGESVVGVMQKPIRFYE